MQRKATSLLAVCVAMVGFVLAVFIPAASAQRAHSDTTACTGTTYDPYCPPSTTTTATTSSTTATTASTTTSAPSTATPGPTATAAPTTTTAPVAFVASPEVLTKVISNATVVALVLPTGASAQTLTLSTLPGVSFGVNHSVAAIQKDIKIFQGPEQYPYTITSMSRAHGRIALRLFTPLQSPVLEVNKSIFEFTPKEAAMIRKHKITTTKVSVLAATKTGHTYALSFQGAFGKLVVVPFH